MEKSMKKLVLLGASALLFGSLVVDEASAQRGFGGGGFRGGGGFGGGGFRGGFGGGGFRGGFGGPRFVYGGGRGFYGGGFRRGFYGGGFRRGFYGYRRPFIRYGIGLPLYVGYPRCYRLVRIATPYGWGWRRIWVCGPRYRSIYY